MSWRPAPNPSEVPSDQRRDAIEAGFVDDPDVHPQVREFVQQVAKGMTPPQPPQPRQTD